MKNTFTMSIIAASLLVGCSGNKNATQELITFDVTETPSGYKDLIIQDFMDVEYIPLETTDEFLHQGAIMYVGDKYIALRNMVNDGNIFIHDRSGKGISKVNRRGQSGEEYASTVGVVIDEISNEMYVNSHMNRTIQVYDLQGNYKRTLKQASGSGAFYTDMVDFDNENLLCYAKFSKDRGFVLVSKQDGSITYDIPIPITERKPFVGAEGALPTFYHAVFPYNDGWGLLDNSSDTIYVLKSDQSLQPFMARTPAISTMDPGVHHIVRLTSDQYIFMEGITNKKDPMSGKTFPKSYFAYDVKDKYFVTYKAYNGDFTDKEELYFSTFKAAKNNGEWFCVLHAPQLVEAYNEGRLKGKLKEVASRLNEDSNPIVMLVKDKDSV